MCIKVVYFNPILSQAPKQYLEMAKYMCFCDKISLCFILCYSSIQDSLKCYSVKLSWFLGCKNFEQQWIYRFYNSITIKQQYMGFNSGNLAFEKPESTIHADIQFSFRNVHYKTVSVPLGTHRLNEKEMTITCHMGLLYKHHAFHASHK